MSVLQFAPVDVEHLCHIVLDSMSASYRRNRVVVMISGQPRTLVSNAECLQTAIQAIALNALHYSNPDRMVRLCLIWKDWGLSLQVHDEGCGIPALDLDRVLESGFRGSNIGSLPGRGMGLKAAKDAIESVNAAIDIHSVEDIGTTVTLNIPNYPTMVVPVPAESGCQSLPVTRQIEARS